MEGLMDQRMSKHQLQKIRVRRMSILIALLAMAVSISGCKSPSGGASTTALVDCAALTKAFRGFHQRTFPTNWACEEGVLRSLRGPSVDLITRKKYKDFDLELEWKATPRANSGILYGVTETTKETYWSGPEMQINDDPNHPDGRTPNHSAGALYDIFAPNDQKHLQPTGEYNHTRVISRKGHVEHWLNGAKILEYDWDSPETRSAIAHTKFKDAPYFMKNRNGYIALQHHGDEVWFRNIRIRRL